MSRDSEVRDIADHLEELLDKLADNIAAMSAILDPAEEATPLTLPGYRATRKTARPPPRY